jgi:PAS domain S-box-containing protein
VAAKALVWLLPVMLGSNLLMSWGFADHEADILRREQRQNLETFAELQTTAVMPLLWSFDMPALRKLFRAYSLEPDVAGVELYDPNGHLLLDTGETASTRSDPDLSIWKSVAIEQQGKTYHLGDLLVRFNVARLQLERRQRLQDNIAITVLVTLISAIAIVLVVRFRISRPLKRLLHSLETAATDHVRAPVDWASTDELGQVMTAYNKLMRREAEAEEAVGQYRDHLEEMVSQRTHDLADREAYLRAIFENAGVGIASSGPDGALRQVNDHLRLFVGKNDGEMIGRSLTTYMHPDDAGVAEDLYRQIMLGRLDSFQMEGRFFGAGGGVLWVSLTAAAIFGQDRQVAHVISVVADITTVRTAGERFRALLESTPDVMVITDINGTIAMVNHRAEAFFGYSRQEMIGEPFARLLPERFRERQVCLWEAFAESSSRRYGEEATELSALTRDGREIAVEVSLSPISTDQGILVASAMRDVTLRRQAEEATAQARRLAEQASRAKSEFLANVSHEIRTPMNAILGLSHLALTSEAPQRAHLEKIHAAARTLLAIINDILDYSKLDSGGMSLDVRPFHLDNVFDHLRSIYAPKAADAGLTLSLVTPSSLRFGVIGDPQRLEQVLSKMLDNALKFTDTGGASLGCVADIKSDGQVRLCFIVADTGIGMTAEQVQSLFRPFQQGDGRTTRRYGGTGLGLAISQRMIEMMGGELTVSSIPGEGTVLKFVLVLKTAPEPCLPQEALPPEALPEPASVEPSVLAVPLSGDLLSLLSRLRAMIVDDDTEALSLSRELADRFAETTLVVPAAKLVSLLAGYDFPAALQIMDDLISLEYPEEPRP